MYYTQIQSNLIASYLVGGLDGLTTYTAVPGQLGFPTCLTGSCLPLSFDPKTLAASELPARDITIQAGRRSFYEAQFAKYGLNFDLLPNYPDKLVNPRSQVVSIGAEREVVKGLFASADWRIGNLVISLLRLAGSTNIAAALRHHARDAARPLELLGIT